MNRWEDFDETADNSEEYQTIAEMAAKIAGEALEMMRAANRGKTPREDIWRRFYNDHVLPFIRHFEWLAMHPPILVGGQGRTPTSLHRDSSALLFTLLVLVALVVLLVCAS